MLNAVFLCTVRVGGQWDEGAEDEVEVFAPPGMAAEGISGVRKGLGVMRFFCLCCKGRLEAVGFGGC